MTTDTQDLGALKGPLLIFGGPYSNAQATETLIATAANLGIPPERCICTGDVVAYCADAKATTSLIRDFGCPVVLGNCEESLGNQAEDCGCGFEDGTACDLLSKQWYAHAQSQLDEDDRAWMAARPRKITFTHAGKRVAVIHGAWAGGPEAINQFLFESLDDAVFEAEFEALEADVILAGHSGLPFAKSIGAKLWLNAGVIGMPANDANPATWYAILDGDGSHRFHRLDYDHHGAATEMRLANLSEDYASGLETGLWPNLDILPPAETKQTGLPLDPNQDLTVTEKVFWHEPKRYEDVAQVISVRGPWVRLDRSIFFAESGGQESDRGSFHSIDVQEARWAGQNLYYRLAPDHGLRTGNVVNVMIDPGRRQALTRLHFAAEIVLELIYARFPGIEKVGAHISAEKARIDFAWDDSFKPIAPEIEQAANDLITADHPIISAFEDEAKGRRYWEIEGFAKVPCGGTHPASTGEVGEIAVKRQNPGKGKERLEITLVRPT